MTVKKVFGKVHLWLGLASGLIILIVALTGSLMVFEEELELVFHRDLMEVKEVKAARKTYDELAAVVQAAYPGKKIKGFTIYPEIDRSVLFSVGRNKQELLLVSVDQYSGEILGQRDHNKRFFTTVLKLHRYLLMGDTGKTITGISCLIFITLLISGLVIWWPKTKAAMRQRFRVNWKAKFRRVNWDFHAVFGFYSFLVLFVIAASGLVFAFPWVNKMLFLVADGKPQSRVKAPVNVSPDTVSTAGIYEKMLAATDRELPYAGEIRVNVPPDDSVSINISKENHEVRLANVASTVWLDRRSGEILRARHYEKETAGTKARRLIKPIHTGSVYGWPTKLLALVVSLFAASLPVTGTMIWLGRIRKKKKAPGRFDPGLNKSASTIPAPPMALP